MRLEGWPQVKAVQGCHPSRRGQRVRAKRGPMINSDAAPQDEVCVCEPFGFKESIRLGRDQFVMRERNGAIRHQFVAEHAGFFPRRLGREAPQQNQ
jgi:hypothetical protein